VEDRYGLCDIADEILALQRQLDDAYKRRSETILEALSDGHSLRDIAEFLGISHTAVAKAIAGV
jgi:DNA-binding NarL/FixJ family response regulator